MQIIFFFKKNHLYFLFFLENGKVVMAGNGTDG
jgi:hypothetical protein